MSIEFDWVDYEALPGASGLFRALMKREPVVRERFPKLYWESGHLTTALRHGPRPASASARERADHTRRLPAADRLASAPQPLYHGPRWRKARLHESSQNAERCRPRASSS